MNIKEFIKSISNSEIKKVQEYIFLISSEYSEVNKFINELKNYEPFHFDIGEATTIQKALDIAVVISYARNFKKSRGFFSENITKVNNYLIEDYSDEEKKLHNKIINDRDSVFAHSDSKYHDIDLPSRSKIRVRQPLEKEQIIILHQMVTKIRSKIREIEKIIQDY